MQNIGRCLVVAGRNQPVWVHELALLMNRGLGSFGRSIELVESRDTTFSSIAELRGLTEAVRDGEVSTLVMLGGDPSYSAYVDLDFKSLLSEVETTIHLSDHEDELQGEMTWHLPAAHYLESWSDVRSVDGIPGIVQPLVAPLHGGKSDLELLGLMATGRDRRGYDIVRETWQDLLDGEFEDSWRRVLHDGLLGDRRSGSIDFNPKRSAQDVVANISLPPAPDLDRLDVLFQPSNLYDGRYANNGWLMELPDPVSKLAWDNAALISPATAKALGVESGDVVTLAIGERSIEIPAWILPGQSNNSVVLPLGFGRTSRGRIAEGAGVNGYQVRTTGNPYVATGATVGKTGRKRKLANVQDHSLTEGRAIVLEASLKEYREVPEIFDYLSAKEHYRNMYEPYDYSKGYQWGMTIDLTLCTGCGACTVACQGENNIPVVGRDAVERGREMHWIRVDRYFRGDEHDPRIVQMPMPCQQCENAPCESVCPVVATVHDSEGLNTMNYNRCIGTRYCSNNCPYKVRRFNFFHYTGDMPELMKMVQNPDVTVRSRGVMEKCTYCLQRLNRAKYRAKEEGRTLADGEVQTACQQACPTKAIHFGNINDRKSRVVADKEQMRNYELLGELNIRPRTSYLGKLRNPNPELLGYKPEQA
jgi:molybdopterin-containing oxidoreductase family iron-sulfur binding subunit